MAHIRGIPQADCQVCDAHDAAAIVADWVAADRLVKATPELVEVIEVIVGFTLATAVTVGSGGSLMGEGYVDDAGVVYVGR